MAKKKGMSLDEKRAVMLSIFHDTKEVFALKELEKLGSKRGVVQQTVEEVVKSLVDDRLVECEKIGSGNFYWSFPSKAYVALKRRVDALRDAAAADTSAISSLEAQVAAAASGREDPAARAAQLARLDALRKEDAELSSQLAAHAESDPDALRDILAKAKVAKAGADRWTDNTWTTKAFLIDKFGKEAGECDRMLGITDSFDYLK